MRLNISLLIVFAFAIVSASVAQNGYIRGTIFDKETGESLPGVTLVVGSSSTMVSSTDLDGKFNVNIAPGSYDVKISFISYETVNIQGVQVKAGETTILDDIGLSSATIDLVGVTVTAQVVKNTDNALLAMKKKSANVMDGVSAASLKKTGDGDAASSIKRVSGVSVSGGKYVFVRGLGDRYTKTILNGVDVPGLDPDRNTLQMDIFPTSIIDNILVYKSFSAELPADFTGGVVNISTKDFPEEKKASISVSAGYNPDFHFNSNYLTYEGGKTDWLGFDDGTRDIPATNNIPLFSEVVGNPDSEDGRRYRQILESFNPTMAAMKENSFMDYSIGATVGNQVPMKNFTMGYNVSLNYKNSTEFYENAEYGRYGLSADPTVTEMEVRELQTGSFGTNNVLISGLASYAIKTANSKYSIDFLRLQNGETKAGVFDYYNADQGAVFYGIQNNLEYSQRSLTNVMLHGKHYFDARKWNVDWKISPTFSKIEDPDIRFTRYEIRGDDYVIGTEAGFPERIWRSLEEVNISSVVGGTKDYKFLDRKAKFKTGAAYTYKERDFAIQSFQINVRNLELTGDPNELFQEDNLWPHNGDATSGTTYESTFFPTNPNQFNSNVNYAAAYASTEIMPFERLKTIVGVRVENYVQKYTGQDQLGDTVLNNAVVLDDFDIFPTINIVYSLSEITNLRASYSKTIARPSFKELSYAEIYDPVTGRTFVGGLFRDENRADGIVYWDGNLQSSDIHNFDLRYEIFQDNGRTISVGGFYKMFKNPIEIIQYAVQAGAFQPRNVGDGEVYGLEVEFSQSLRPFSETLKNFRVNANVTVAESRIKLSQTEYESRVANAREGQSVGEYRDMAGQAPLIINGGFSYAGGTKGFADGLEAGIYYNVQGTTLQYVGMVDRPDVYSKPFHSLNFNANKALGEQKKLSVGIKVENMLTDVRESVFQSFNAQDQFFTRLAPGMTFNVRLKYNIF